MFVDLYGTWEALDSSEWIVFDVGVCPDTSQFILRTLSFNISGSWVGERSVRPHGAIGNLTFGHFTPDLVPRMNK